LPAILGFRAYEFIHFWILPADRIFCGAQVKNALLSRSDSKEFFPTKPTAIKAISGLVNAGILVESTGRRRDRAYSFDAYLNLLRTGTDSAE
jgi:hypothetical protein